MEALSYANAKMLKNFKFHTFIGRFQVTPWQGKGYNHGPGIDGTAKHDNLVI